jgi:hypothetical protein
MMVSGATTQKKKRERDEHNNNNDGDGDNDDDDPKQQKKRATISSSSIATAPPPTTSAPATTTTSPYYLPAPMYERERFLCATRDPDEVFAKLLRYGVAIVPEVLSPERAQTSYNGLMDALESVFPAFKRDDRSTWRQLRDNGAKHAMLLQTHGLGWCQSAVDLRQDPAIAQLFTDLWNARSRFATQRKQQKASSSPPLLKPTDMLSSGDGVSVYLNERGSRGGFHREGHEWLHWDRAPSDDKWSVQGFVNLLPTSEHGAAFQCLVKSHRYQQEFAERFKAGKRFNLLRNQAEVNFFVKEKGCAHVCAAPVPGDMVLWDSRTIHCGRAATKEARLLQRAVVYVSMQPKCLSTPRDLELKRRAYAQLRSTTHNAAAGVDLFTVYQRVRCAKDDALKKASRPIRTPPTLTPLGRSLFGLE